MVVETETAIPDRLAVRAAEAPGLWGLFDAGQAHAERMRYAKWGTARFARDVLGIHLWRGQRDACRAVESGERVVAIKSGHGIGKTLLGGVFVCWWMAAGGPGTVVVTSAPTGRQVEELLWREVNRLWNRSPLLAGLGTPLTTQIKLAADWVAYGFTTRDPNYFQGWHAPMLRFLIDEANGFPENLWQPIDACLTGGNSQLVMIGNPIVPVGRFFRAFGDPAVRKLTVSSRGHPNVRSGRELIPGAVTAGWIADMERRYATEPDMLAARIDGEFPEGGSHRAVVPLEYLRRARNVEPKTLAPAVYAVDIARYGDSLTVLTRFSGQRLDYQVTWAKHSTTYTANRIEERFRDDPADVIVVDDTGVGGGVTDQLEQHGLPVFAFVGGEKATQADRFVNLNAEAWWACRECLEADLIAIGQAEGELEQQFASREYDIRADKKIVLEAKPAYTKRTGMPSPDHADSFAMGVWWLASHWRAMVEEGR